MSACPELAPAAAQPDGLAARLAALVLKRSAGFSIAAIGHAATVLVEHCDQSRHEAERAIRRGLVVAIAPEVEKLPLEAAVVLHELISELVATDTLDDEERPAFVFADFIDRSGLDVETARPMFEAVLSAARQRALAKGPSATSSMSALQRPPCSLCRRNVWFRGDFPGAAGWICATCHPPVGPLERFIWSGKAKQPESTVAHATAGAERS